METTATTVECGSTLFDAIGIQVQRNDGGTHKGVTGRLLNLSLRGAKLALDASIPALQDVTLKMQNRCLHAELSTGGKIRRIQPGGDGTWIVGCQFNEPLPRLALRNLFHGDRAEQRKFVRYRVVGDAKIDWESGPQNVVVQLEDISVGGFRMRTLESAGIGARLTLSLHTAQRKRFTISAVTRWQLESSDGYNVGCQFLYDQGAYLLEAILPKAADERPKALARVWAWVASFPRSQRSG